MRLPAPLEAVVDALQKLPGVGSKSAQRMALHLLKEGPGAMEHLGDLLRNAASSVGFCSVCGAFTDRPVCPVCADPQRDARTLVVVAEASNVLTFERSGHFHGRYHVLGGLISPLKGIGPDQLKVKERLARREPEGIAEVILCTNPNIEGEATAMYISRLLKPLGLKVTRIASGLPVGGDLEYADELTLGRALEGRREID